MARKLIPKFSPPPRADFPPRKSAGQSPASLRRRAIASRGVSVRFWSSAFSAPVRMPGVTSWMCGGKNFRKRAISSGEQTRPRKPDFTASCARRTNLFFRVRFAADFRERVVVRTGQNRHAENERRVADPDCFAVSCADFSAARIISPPPLVWIVSICTSSRTAEATALATVFGMS